MNQNTEEINIKEYIQILSSRWYIFLLLLIVSISGAFFYILTTPRIYESTGTIAIFPKNLNLTREANVDVVFMKNTRNYLQTQYKLILSEPILQQVFDHFNFGEKKQFTDVKDPLKEFQKLFTVSPVRQSFIVNVSFEWIDPQLPPRVVDFLQKTYIETERKRNLNVSDAGIDILYDKERELRNERQNFSEKLEKYVNAYKLINLESTQSIIIQKLSEINVQLTKVELLRISYYTSYQETAAALSSNMLISVPEVVSNRTIQELKVQKLLVDQELESLTLGRNLGQNHPQVLSLKAKKNIIEERLKIEVLSIIQSLKNTYLRYKKEEERLRGLFANQQKEAFLFSRRVDQYNQMKKEYAELEKNYFEIKNRLDDLQIKKDAGDKEENIFISSPPRTPKTPIRPKSLFILIGAFLGALFSGVTLCFLLEFLNNSIKGKEQAEKILHKPVIGFLPSSPKNKKQKYPEVFALSTRSVGAEAFRSIRTSLSFSFEKNSVIFVTSPLPGDGKTFTCANLAAAMTQNDARVLLVDADMRKARQHQIWEIPRYPGLSNLIADSTVTPQQVIQYPEIKNLEIISAGVSPPNPLELLEKPRFLDYVQKWQQEYDYVFIDCPPIVVVADAIVISKVCTTGVLVVKSFKTKLDAVKMASDIIKNNEVKICGVLLNNVDVPQGRYESVGYYNYQYYGDEGKNDGIKL